MGYSRGASGVSRRGAAGVFGRARPGDGVRGGRRVASAGDRGHGGRRDGGSGESGGGSLSDGRPGAGGPREDGRLAGRRS
jgi:hypothetical protein